MSWRRSPLPPDWPVTRLRILERDDHTCQIRGPRCIGVATEVDHIGDHDVHEDWNLRAACTPCHRSRTGRQGQAARPSTRRASEPHPGLIRATEVIRRLISRGLHNGPVQSPEHHARTSLQPQRAPA